MAENEAIMINKRILMLGVLSTPDGTGYQLYLAPGMSVAELAFDCNVIIRLLLKDNYIKSKEEFDALVTKYFNDSQYDPIERAKTEARDVASKRGGSR